MVAMRNTADSQAAICPACGAAVKLRGRGSQRMQCPRCRQGVVFEKPEAPPQRSAENGAVPPAERDQQQARIDALEARIVALEKAVAAPAITKAKDEPAVSFAIPASKNGNRPLEFSPEQAELLLKNLNAIPVHWITILSPKEDAAACARAEWFRKVFESAQWYVHCPDDPQLTRPARGLCFASRVPATPEVAATYFAIRGAGFDLATQNDPDLKETEQRLIIVS